MIKKDLISSLVLFFFGAFLASLSCRHSVWSQYGPDEGFYPLAIALIIMALSLSIVFKSVFFLIQRRHDDEDHRKESTSYIYKVLSYGILMLLLGSLLETMGYVITSTLFMLVILKYVEKQSWKVTLLVTAISVFISYVLFVHCLGVPLPRGVLG